MKTHTLVIGSLLLLFGVVACEKVGGDGNLITDTRAMVPFTGITQMLNCDIKFVNPDTVFRYDSLKKKWARRDSVLYKVTLRAESNICNLIETKVVNGRVLIKLKDDKRLQSYEPISVEVMAPDLTYIEMTGTGSITVNLRDSTIRSFLDCKVSGNGSLNFRHIRYSYLKVNVTGPGYIFCDSTGTAMNASLTSMSNGTINLFNLRADTVYANASGAGDISVSADSLLDGTISGTGNIWYKGAGPTVKSNITGKGKIIHL